MTRTARALKGFVAMLVTLAMTVALGVGAFASAADTVTETVVVTQVITDGTSPSRTSYTYVLTPKDASNPMPEGTVDGVYTLPTINGETTDDTAPSFTIEIDKTKPGVYEYTLEKKETTPSGDTLSPTSHIFGFKVEYNDDGKLATIPYICQSGSPVFSDPDENGYPTRLTLTNAIAGPVTSSKTTTTTTTKTVTTQKGATTRAGTTGSSSKANWVNTGDESQLILWVAILGVAAVGLIILILARRRHDEDDEENL